MTVTTTKQRSALLVFGIAMITISSAGCSVLNQKDYKDDWLSKDKYAHLAISTVMSAATAKAAKDNGNSNCDAAMIGFTVSLSIGAAKETYDKRKKKTLYSHKDMTWNLAGSALGSLAASNCK